MRASSSSVRATYRRQRSLAKTRSRAIGKARAKPAGLSPMTWLQGLLVGLILGLFVGHLLLEDRDLKRFFVSKAADGYMAAAQAQPEGQGRQADNWLQADARHRNLAALPRLLAFDQSAATRAALSLTWDQVSVGEVAKVAGIVWARPWTAPADTVETPDAVTPGAVTPDAVTPEAVTPEAVDLEILEPGEAVTQTAAAWRQNAVPVAAAEGRPMIAVVIDDVGPNRKAARRTIDLPPPLTLALLTYTSRVEELAEAARAAGHELLVHMPMEPKSHNEDPGPNALLTSLPAEELQRRIDWGLERFQGFVGINNHMGSAFTRDGQAMALVMKSLKHRGLLFLDSMTVSDSAGRALARRYGVVYAERDIFLDNDYKNAGAIRKQLAKVERAAKRHGTAVAIGHPHAKTLAELARWIPEAKKRGFHLVPISAIAAQRIQMVAGRDSAS